MCAYFVHRLSPTRPQAPASSATRDKSRANPVRAWGSRGSRSTHGHLRRRGTTTCMRVHSLSDAGHHEAGGPADFEKRAVSKIAYNRHARTRHEFLPSAVLLKLGNDAVHFFFPRALLYNAPKAAYRGFARRNPRCFEVLGWSDGVTRVISRLPADNERPFGIFKHRRGWWKLNHPHLALSRAVVSVRETV